MHPWGWSLCGVDVGAFMCALKLALHKLRAPVAAAAELPLLRYKHVHKVHHKSKNPGPWSGLSM